jgi:hypothetical protein
MSFMETRLDTIPIPVFFKDAQGVYQGCNRVFSEKIVGLPKDEIVGRTVFDLKEAIPADLATTYDQQDEELVRNPGQQIYESQAQGADGKRRDYLLHKATCSDDTRPVNGRSRFCQILLAQTWGIRADAQDILCLTLS